MTGYPLYPPKPQFFDANGAAGAASALPNNPSGYLRFYIGTTEYVLPYYKQA